VPDVEQWLDDLDLRQYAQTFVKNGVDSRALRYLTEQDLQDLGVLLGHRRILMAAIAKLAGQNAGVASDAGEPGASIRDEAERRQLTVMFCDLVGSTALSTELDVEDYRELIRTFHDICANAVARYDGFLAKFMGDGLLAYFGYPAAHDDDAQRAARAALDVVTEATRLEFLPGRHPAVRIGIATGEVVVGDLVVHGVTEAASVLGATPNLAARLQGAANANEIVVSDTTRRRLRDGFVVDDLGELALKGIREPIRAWRIKGLAEPSIDAGGAIPFVGRRDALAKIAKAWERAQSGKFEIIQVVGQPGIGKSRLVREFIALDLEAKANTIIWTCSPYHRNSPLHPVSPELLPRDAAGAETGEAQRRALFETIAGRLAQRTGAVPTVLFVEDGHWIDPTTAELLERLRHGLADHAILLLIASRPGPVADRLNDGLGSAALELGILDAADAELVVDSMSGGTFTPSVRQEILGRAGGLPLFLEELTRVVARSGAATIPASLQDSLQARLDGLGPAKRVAQFASAIGRTFSRTDLAALSGLAGVDLDQALDRLVSADVLIELDGHYAFRHVVIQDVAYQSLLRSSRRRIHGEIADYVVGQGQSADPEHVARHLSGAERRAEAAPRWREAGRRSAGMWAHAEASSHYNSALQDAAELGDDRWELEVRLDLVESLRILDRYSEALMQLDRAQALAGKVGRDRDWLRVHLLRGGILFPLGQAEECVAAHQDALAVAQKMDAPDAEARALSGLADAHFASRRLVTAERTYDDCVRLAEANGLDAVTLANLSLRGHMRLYLCRIEESRTDCEKAVEMSVRAGNRRAEVMARGSCLGKVLLESGEFAQADKAFADAGRLAAEIGAHRYEALNLLFRGKVALATGARADALMRGRRAVVLAQEAGPRFCLPLALGVVARAQETADACRSVLKQAEALIAAGCLTHNPLWFYRDAALAAVAHGWPDEARRYATALRDAFSLEPVPWCDLVADGADALAALLETGDRARVEAVRKRARALGFVGWARALDAASKERSPG
jgi:class 3 adenylate cyclase/tetratricopeptide (TPR) repeat protein